MSININKNLNEEEIKKIALDIKKGKIAIFPTETVYGIGTNALNENACAKIFEIKGRNNSKALIVLISNYKMLESIVTDINEIERKLMNKFWPGPLTIILKKKEIVPNVVTGGSNEVGVRMTSGEVAHFLVEKAGVPIVAPSANLSGEQTGTKIKIIIEEFSDKVDYIIDTGDIESDLTSTVVKVENNKIRILREGKIIKEELSEIAEIVI